MSRRTLAWAGAAAILAVLMIVLVPAVVMAKKPVDPPPDPEPDPDPAIAYMVDGDLMVMNADGSNQTVVRADIGVNSRPSWSPDGEQLAFYCDADGKGVYTINLDGTGLTKVAATLGWANVAWSPTEAADGNYKLAFSASSSLGSSDLFLVNLDGSGLVNLTETGDVWEGYPTWSPSADRIAAQVIDGNDSDIVVFELDVVEGEMAVTDTLNLTGNDDVPGGSLNGRLMREPSWARTGDVIAAPAYDSSAVRDIWAIDLDDPANPTNLSDTSSANESAPCWSPDDSAIVLWRPKAKSAKAGIYVLDVATGSQTLIVSGSEWPYADWRRE